MCYRNYALGNRKIPIALAEGLNRVGVTLWKPCAVSGLGGIDMQGDCVRVESDTMFD